MKGARPTGENLAEYERCYSEEERGYIEKILHMTRFTNCIGNTFTPAFMKQESVACMIESRDWAKEVSAAAAPRDHARVMAPPPLLFGLVLAAGLILDRVAPLAIPVVPLPLIKAMGTLLLLAAAGIMVPTALLMLKHKTALRPDRTTTTLVCGGFFRYSRNPLYFSLLLVYSGIALHANSLWLFFFLPVLFMLLDRGVVRREEIYLESKFGDDYLRYKAKVRRWI